MTKPPDPKEFLELFKDTNLESSARALMPEPTPPQYGETAVVALNCPRTAALCFDRVWSLPTDETRCPDGIRFSMTTDAELVAALFLHVFVRSRHQLEGFTDMETLAAAIMRGDIDTILGREDFAAVYCAALLGITLTAGWDFADFNPLDKMSRVISDNLQKTGRKVYPIYTSEEKRDEEFKTGQYRVVVGSLRDLEIVDEEYLSWEQVLEFRDDSEIKADYRKFIHWLDGQMVGKPTQYVIDEIGVKYDKYKTALRKHGLKTKIGVLASMIDSKTLLSSIAAVGGAVIAGEPLFGALAAAGVLLGKSLVTIGEAKIDLENIREQYGEIAFVAQVNERLSKQKKP